MAQMSDDEVDLEFRSYLFFFFVVPCQTSQRQSRHVVHISWPHLNDQVEEIQVVVFFSLEYGSLSKVHSHILHIWETVFFYINF